ncbi:hypothetical protein SESBI_42928 [Sesbania bispinosa]|nr:hypothetical protein SESBI_42928 [Sesbania bispinosa]
MLLELTQLASPYKPSCAERVVAYFAKAMTSRVMNSWLGVCSPLINQRSINSSFQVFNNISPFIKFAHFTSNQAILEAVNRTNSIHIIDLDIMQGLQWPPFFHILATRMEGPPEVRMTGMGTSMELLVKTGKQLSNFARRLGLSFKFNPVATKFGEIDVSMVQVRHGETLAVHWHSVGHGLLSKEINNILAIGGPARSGEDKFRQWRSELARHCFVQVPMSANSVAQAQLILNMFSPAHGYSLAQVDGTLRLGWKDTDLYTASAWTSSTSR